MKKLLVLALVLGIAGISSAALELVLIAPDTVGVSSSDTAAWSAVVAWAPEMGLVVSGYTEAGQGGLTDTLVYGPYAPGDLGLALPEPILYLENLLPAGTPADGIDAGIQWTAQFANAGTFYLISEDLSTVLGSVQIVPEPATLALLGLGVLALRRKK